MQQNIRVAMYYMQREIRMAGSNPFRSFPLTNFGITAAGRNSITFTEDVRGPVAGTPAVQMAPDGNAGDPDENITYALNGTNLERTDNIVAPGVPQMVARDINWLDFVYLDVNSNVLAFDVTNFVPTANISQIRSVEITIVARTNDPLLYGSKNYKVYWNQRQGLPGAQSFSPAGDHVSRRRLTTKIYCRNLDL